VTSPSFGVRTAPWAPADATTGTAAGSAGTYREALAAVAAAVAADPGARGALRIAPGHSLFPVIPKAPTKPPPGPPPPRKETVS
jgi:hypothetical protein